jgi:hypothetical protein
MDEPQVAQAITGFLEAIDDIGLESAYPYPITNTTGALPDVVVFISDTNDATTPPADLFPGQDIQEAWWRTFQISCSFMVEVSEQTEGAAADAWSTIEGMVAKIREAVATDLTLGDRLEGETICSPMLHFDFSEPFIAREDQTRGRHFTLEMTIAERIASPEGFWPAA